MYVHQSIDQPLGVTVFGSHLLGVEPDRATVAFAVAHIANLPGDALAQVEQTRAAVNAVLAKHRLTSSDVTTSRVSVELAVDGYGKDRQVLGYRAQIEYEARSSELAAVPALIIELVDAGARAIKSVRYASSKLRELRAHARELAFGSARAKAESYAHAAGLKVGRALHIEDVNPDSIKDRGHGTDVDLTSHDEIGAASSGSITVSGAVMVCFALVDP